LSRIAAKLQGDDLTFERLDVDASVAQRMFEDNRFTRFSCPVYSKSSVTFLLYPYMLMRNLRTYAYTELQLTIY